MNSGIYEIVNTQNGKRYIGSAVSFTKRWGEHRWRLRTGTHNNAPLQCSHNKYGKHAFKFRKLIICSRENLLMYEQAAIDALKPEFNILKTAGNLLGFRHSEETRAKMSAAHAGKKHTAEARAKISAANKGQIVSAEQRARLREVRLGSKHTAETLAKFSAMRKGNKYCLGYKHTDEARARMSASQRARMTPEYRARLSAAHLGKKRGPYNLKKSKAAI